MSGLGNHALHGTGLAGNTASPVHRLDPRAKVVGFLGLTLVAVTTPLEAWPVYLACALVLAGVAALGRIGPSTVWRRTKFILPLVLFVAVFLPFFRGGHRIDLGPLSVSEAGLAAFAAVSVKAVLGTVSAVLLGATTTFPATLRALESLRVPRLLVLIAGFVYRYLFVVVDEVQRMRAALSARGYQPRTALHASALGRIASALFLRTHARGERVYLAMVSRGYRGSMPALETLRFRVIDAAFVAAIAACLLAASSGDHAMACLINARNVSYRYPDGREALRGVTLAVEHGERVAVLGPNGAGKTTFVYHLNGLLRGEGSLEVAGLEVDDSTLRRLRPRVGLVFQDPDDQLFMPTVREDVAFGPLNMGETQEVVAARVDDALRTVRMEHAADRPPHQLSMGERRRVAIATVLAMRPQLLVLDEPTANLDPRGRRELLDVLTRIERTMLVVTHDLPFAAQLCERAVILSGGQIAADGACAEILADADLLAAHDLELPAGFDVQLVTLSAPE